MLPINETKQNPPAPKVTERNELSGRPLFAAPHPDVKYPNTPKGDNARQAGKNS